MKDRCAYYQSLARAIGLGTADLCEIGGWKAASYPRRIMAGVNPFPEPVRDAIAMIDADTRRVANQFEAQILTGDIDFIPYYHSQEALRHDLPGLWPPRGQAKGGFIGPHAVAVSIAGRKLLGFDAREIVKFAG